MPAILRHKLVTACLVFLGLMMIGTLGYYCLGLVALRHDHWPLIDCLYMTVISLTTVGYGEVIPVAEVPGARAFTMFILVSGLGVSAYFVSTLTAFLLEGEIKHVFWRAKMDKVIGKLHDHIILCGAGRVGCHILEELVRTGKSFALIENNMDIITDLQQHFGFFPAVAGDATHAQFLQEAGIESALRVVSALHDDKDNLCIVVTCKQLNPNVQIISRCSNREFAQKLQLVGADVVIPNLIGGLRMASQAIRPRVVRYMDIMLRDKRAVMRVEECFVAESSPLVGREVGGLNLRHFGNLLLLAIMHEDNDLPLYNPASAYVIRPRDVLVLQAEGEAYHQFIKENR